MEKLHRNFRRYPSIIINFKILGDFSRVFDLWGLPNLEYRKSYNLPHKYPLHEPNLIEIGQKESNLKSGEMKC